MIDAKQHEIAILTPCFNENTGVISFLTRLTETIEKLPFVFLIIVIDDASTDNTVDLLSAFQHDYGNIEIRLITLKYNCGHQGAIYQGFLYARGFACKKFIVIDSDGEDDPSAINELVFMEQKIVTVVRGKRLEGFLFRMCYKAYKLVFYAVTGKRMNFGNYCMIDHSIFSKTCHSSFTHLAAHLSRQNVDKGELKYSRMKRISGKSKMNFSSLTHHAFKSFVEYSEDFLSVFLKIFLIVVTAAAALLAMVLYKKLISNDAVLGWASSMSVGLLNSALISLGVFALGLLLLNISNRKAVTGKEVFVEVTRKTSKKNAEETVFYDD